MKKYKFIQNTSIIILCLGLLTLIYKSVTGYSSFRFDQLSNLHEQSNQRQLDEFNDQQGYYEEFNSQIALNNYDNALSICLSRIKKKPFETISIYIDIGELYNAKGDLDSAIYYFSKATLAALPRPEAFGNRGWAYYRKDLYEKAEKDLKIAAEINYDYYFALGIVQERIDKNKAIESYKMFIQNSKDNSECKQRLDSLQLSIKQDEIRNKKS